MSLMFRCFVLLVTVVITTPALAVTFTVTTTADVVENATVPGACSLREAVNCANGVAPSSNNSTTCDAVCQTAATALKAIVLANGAVYDLTLPAGAADTNAGGELDLTGSIGDVAIGLLGGTATIRQTIAGQRVIDALAGAGRVTLANLIIRDGAITGNGGCISYTGGFLSPGSAPGLTLSGTTVRNCTAIGNGGGIYFNSAVATATMGVLASSVIGLPAGPNAVTGNGGGIYFDAGGSSLQIDASSVSANQAHSAGGGGNGGGIYFNGNAIDDLLTVSNGGRIGDVGAGNTAAANGGGIYFASDQSLQTLQVLTGSFVSSNSAVNGGGIAFMATTGTAHVVSIAASTVTANLASGDGAGIHFTASSNSDHCSLLTTATVSNNTATGNGGGVLFAAPANPDAQLRLLGSSSLAGNTATDGGGAQLTGVGAVTGAAGAQVIDNTATSDGGGLHVANGTVSLNGNRIIVSGNHANGTTPGDGFGGGILCTAAARACALTGVDFTDNRAENRGGALYTGSANSSTATATNVTFAQNRVVSGAGGGGAVYVAAGAFALTSSTLGPNNAAFEGGGIYNLGITAITSSSVTNNGRYPNAAAPTITTSAGGGVFSLPPSPNGGVLVLSSGVRPTFTGNFASDMGGAINAQAASVSIVAADLSANTATNGGGAVAIGGTAALITATSRFTGNSAFDGGAIALTSPGPHTVNDAVVNGNLANMTTGRGGALYVAPGTSVNVRRDSFSGNSASRGGALYIDATAALVGSVNSASTTFDGNSAALAGGAIFSAGSAALSFATITSNVVTDLLGTSGGIHFAPISLAIATGTVTLGRSVLIGNTAAANGDCASVGATMTSQGSNLFRQPAPATCFTAVLGSDVQEPKLVAALFAPLALSTNQPGGTFVETRAPLFGNPAVNAAEAVGAAPCNAGAPDARGVNRTTQGGSFCDAGAYETELDLVLTKSDAPDPVIAGGAVHLAYTITATNSGDIPIAGASFSDTLPAGTTLDTIDTSSAPGWSCMNTGPAVSCSAGAPMPLSGSAAFVVTVSVDAAADPTGSLSNTAVAMSTLADRAGANNADTEATAIDATIALAIPTLARVPATSPLAKGSPVSYSIVLSNAGPSTAVASTFALTLDTLASPDRLIGATWTCMAAGASQCSAPSGNGAPTGVAVTLVAGADITFVVDAFIDPTTTDLASAVDVQATLTPGAAYGGAPVNKNDAAPFMIDPAAAVATLLAAITANPDPSVIAGTSVTFTAQDGNSGPSVSQSVTKTFTVGAAAYHVETLTPPTAAAGFSCGADKAVGDPGPVVVTCTCNAPCVEDVQALADAAIVTMHVPASAPPGATVTADYVLSGAFDADGASASEAVTVTQSADLSVAVTSAPDAPPPGSLVAITITLSNAGPSDANAATIALSLPAGVGFESIAAAPAYLCTTPAVGDPGDISCAIMSLAAMASDVITIVVRLSDTFLAPTVPFAVAVASSATETDVSDNSAAITVTLGDGSAGGAGGGGSAGNDGGGDGNDAGTAVARGCRCDDTGAAPAGEMLLALLVGAWLMRRRRS
ncbi:MAG: DUF11 domain-containing protein [Deltaproteobacteria bacterium]|nr:DUF11 domain-containing protein [Deltaproteobacteria bacterium]